MKIYKKYNYYKVRMISGKINYVFILKSIKHHFTLIFKSFNIHNISRIKELFSIEESFDFKKLT